MEYHQFAAADDAASVHACLEVHQAAARADDPAVPPMGERTMAAFLTHGWHMDEGQTWLARENGAPVAFYRIDFPQRQNKHLALIEAAVHPARRRAGLGTALLRHAAGQAHAAGRSLLEADARHSSAGDAFARAVDARRSDGFVRRVLRFPVDPKRYAGVRRQAAAAAGGYALESWQGPVPDQNVAEVAQVNTAMNDAPHAHEPTMWDTDRVRAGDTFVRAGAVRAYTVVARHAGTAELAGLTRVLIDVDSQWGFQANTAVTARHRGHRLGLLLKTTMMAWLADAEPTLPCIVTGNGATNKHMIAINEALGYEVLDEWSSWVMDTLPAQC